MPFRSEVRRLPQFVVSSEQRRADLLREVQRDRLVRTAKNARTDPSAGPLSRLVSMIASWVRRGRLAVETNDRRGGEPSALEPTRAWTRSES